MHAVPHACQLIQYICPCIGGANGARLKIVALHDFLPGVAAYWPGGGDGHKQVTHSDVHEKDRQQVFRQLCP